MEAEDTQQSSSGPVEPLNVVYCPVCSLPPEYCEYGPSYEECLPWIRENMPHLLGGEALVSGVDGLSISEEKGAEEDGDEEEGEDGGKKKKKSSKKRGGGIGPRKKESGPTKVVISKTNRNKRKFVTSVVGLETVPGLKVKNAAKLLGRHFACGASASETPSGAQEVVIQGDVIFDLPEVLVGQLNVPLDCIFVLEGGREAPAVQM